MIHRSQPPPRSAMESAKKPSPLVPTLWTNASSATHNAKFSMNKRSSQKVEVLEAEVERLREELKEANMEKNEINIEYEKLSTICRSQRQQLHGIKQALASTTPPNKSLSNTQPPGWAAF